MRTYRLARAGIVVLACLAALSVSQRAFAQDGGEKPPGSTRPKNDTQAKAEPAETPSKTRAERAQELVASLEKLLARLDEAGRLDAVTRKSLEDAIAKARELVKPVTAAELTAAERETLEKEFQDVKPRGEQRAKWDRYRDRLVAKALEDTGLSLEEERKASEKISTWYSKSMAARGKGESKLVGDLKRALEKELKALLGRRKAQRVINNLHKLSGPGFGGGGYGPSRPK